MLFFMLKTQNIDLAKKCIVANRVERRKKIVILTRHYGLITEFPLQPPKRTL
jgi:hypothetical protein